MNKIFWALGVSLICASSAFAQKETCASFESDDKKRAFRVLNFDEPGLVKIRSSPHAFEFEADGASYMAVRFSSYEKKLGKMIETKKWCITTVDNKTMPKVLVMDTFRAEDNCEKCSEGQCKANTKVINDQAEPVKIEFNGNSNILQANASGDLFVFQAKGSEKDIKKPYLKLNLEQKVNAENTNEIDNYSVIQTQNAKVSHQLETYYIPEARDKNVPLNMNTASSGVRACEELKLSLKECSKKGLDLHGYSCSEGNKTSVPPVNGVQ